RAGLVGADDVIRHVAPRRRETHKWKTAVGVVAGGPGMMGAPTLCSEGAMRAGAGMVRLGVPGADHADLPVAEMVGTGLPPTDWATSALEWTGRCRALVVGPGLGREPRTREAVRQLVAQTP